ncbi:MAG: DUF4159 domain-containing protein [Rhodothermales bacterium]
MPTRFMRTVLCLLLVLAFAAEAPAQSSRHDVTIARVKYGGGGDWYSGEGSLPNLLAFVRTNTLLDVAPEEDIVELTSDKLFQYPYLYLNGHGTVRFTAREAERLRRYLVGGGFLHINDDYGLDQTIRQEMKKVFPEQEFVAVPFEHEVYHAHFQFPNGLPKVHEHDGKPAQGLGLFHEGRLVVFYSYESDIGDGWEPEGVHNNPPEKRQAALRMGTNLLVYAMTR